MAQEHAEKSSSKAEDAPVDGKPSGLSPESQAKVDKSISETDDLLDDIDAILEPNAQGFVDSFIQKGGQ